MGNWTTIKDLKQQVQKLWDKGMLLQSKLDDESAFPKRLILKTPTSRELSDCYDEVRRWVAALNHPAFRIETKTIRHRVLGENQVPDSAWLDNIDDAIQLIGKQKQAQQFSQIIAETQQRRPELIPWIKTKPIKALEFANNWTKLLDVIDWIKAHPKSGIYLRQVDITGIDTKFIERHRGILITLLDLCLNQQTITKSAKGISQFEARYGFQQKPLQMRFRILDPGIQLLGRVNQDITLTQENFRTLNEDARFANRIRKVFITENEVNFLSLPNVQYGLVLFGKGYGFENLRDVPWLSALDVYYWGDIDTHGFAILNQLRDKLPHAQSMLMDETTLIVHEPCWGQENTAERRKLNNLTAAEQTLYNDLCNDRFAPKLRLEQEKIGFNWLCGALTKIQ